MSQQRHEQPTYLNNPGDDFAVAARDGADKPLDLKLAGTVARQRLTDTEQPTLTWNFQHRFRLQ